MDLRVVVLDYGLGNVRSVQNMLRKAGASAVISSDPHDIDSCDLAVLPGVGAFDSGMRLMHNADLIQPLLKRAADGKFILGICLGMQLLFDSSDEGVSPGLSLIPGRVRKFSFSKEAGYAVPHMGWCEVIPKPSSCLYPADQISRFYFVHSYYAECDDPNHIESTAEYGHEFVCAVRKGNIMGVQFHPEKSHRFGLNFFERVLGECIISE